MRCPVLKPEGKGTKQDGWNLEFENWRGLVTMVVGWDTGDTGFFWKEHTHPDEQKNTSKFKSNLYGEKYEINQNQLKRLCLWVVWTSWFLFEMCFH